MCRIGKNFHIFPFFQWGASLSCLASRRDEEFQSRDFAKSRDPEIPDPGIFRDGIFHNFLSQNFSKKLGFYGIFIFASFACQIISFSLIFIITIIIIITIHWDHYRQPASFITLKSISMTMPITVINYNIMCWKDFSPECGVLCALSKRCQKWCVYDADHN